MTTSAMIEMADDCRMEDPQLLVELTRRSLLSAQVRPPNSRPVGPMINSGESKGLEAQHFAGYFVGGKTDIEEWKFVIAF